MTTDEILNDIRSLVDEYNDNSDFFDITETEGALAEMVRLFEELDAHLTLGAPAPTDWRE